MIDPEPLWLTAKLASITTFILFILSVPLAYWLAYAKVKGKTIIETIVSMPLVLPPSVLGFYLLIAFSPSHGFGKFLEKYFNMHLVFSFTGLVIASIVYSLPFMVHPLQSGFAGLPQALREASYTLGKSKWRTITKILLPNMRSSLLTGIVLTFAHTIGEFGIVLMIGGNIPGETKVASIAIYDEVEMMNYNNANAYALILFIITFIILLTVYLLNQRFSRSSYL
jgi:molybdate transport system permease protein